MDFKEIQAKSILSPCGIPGIDYVINSYTGCRFGCTYCYASFMGRFLKDKGIKDWGQYVYAKINAPELLIKELSKLKDKGKGLEIFLSSVTDPYQGVEAKYQLTRKCLEVIRDCGFEGNISILTKSNLVLRDVDIFKALKHVVVGLTVTSYNDSISRYFEKYAPNVTDRFDALEKLNTSYVCAMDSDIEIIQKNWLELIIKEMEKDQKFGISSGKLVFPDNRLQLLYFERERY